MGVPNFRRSPAATIAVVLLLGSISPVFTFSQDKTTVVFTHVNVVPMDREVVLEDMNVVVSKGKIAVIGRASDVRIPAGAKVIDSRGKFLLPGLMDIHVHIRDKKNLRLYVANGITTVRDMNGSFGTPLEWREEIRQGKLLGPTLISASPTLWGGDPKYKFYVGTPEQAREAVRKYAAQGHDLIKITRMNEDTFLALMDEAKKQNIPVAGHNPGHEMDFESVLSSGMVSIEHITDMVSDEFWKGSESQRFKLAAELIRKHGVTISTMLSEPEIINQIILSADSYLSAEREADILRYSGQAGLENARKFVAGKKDLDEKARKEQMVDLAFQLKKLKLFNDHGVNLVIGTDSHNSINPAGFSFHAELDLLIRGGFTPYEALRAATYNCAKLLKNLDRAGTIAVGKDADFVLSDGNPLRDIGTLRKPFGVMVRGQWLDKKKIEELLK